MSIQSYLMGAFESAFFLPVLVSEDEYVKIDELTKMRVIRLKKTRNIWIISTLGLLLFIIGGAVYSAEEEIILEFTYDVGTPLPKDSELDILVASDIHYLSPELVEGDLLHDSLLKTGDGKVTHRSEELVDYFIADVLEKDPDLLILSGDLTFDGEKQSHSELSDKLSVLTDNGIDVNVIPGNHDINVYSSRGFTADSTYPVDSITDEEFAEIYADFGYEKAISRDSRSLSYATALSEDTWIILLDSNKYRYHNQHRKSISSGSIQEETMEWLEFVLKESERQGIQPIVVSHHSVLNHHSSTNNDFTLDNSDEVVKLLNKFNVKLAFTGHIHIQHIANEGNLYDIASGSLSVYPNYYGDLKLNPKENELTYKTTRLKEQDEFLSYAEAFFDEVSRRKVLSQLYYFELDELIIQDMAHTFVQFNNAYFAGIVPEEYDAIKQSPGYHHWETISGIRFVDYIINGLEAESLNANELKIPSKD